MMFALSVQAQTFSIGTDNVQLGVSENSVFTEASYTQDLVWKFNTKLSVGAVLHQSQQTVYVFNENTRRDNGVTEPSNKFAVMPSAMIGIDIPIKDFSIGIYTGFRSYNLDPFFEPVSLSLNF